VQEVSLFKEFSVAQRTARFGAGGIGLPSFLDEAHRLHSFVPPFRFSAFFSPEDTLLCVCASESAIARLERANHLRRYTRIAELTTGSGLVGFRLLLDDDRNRLIGLDVDCRAIETAGDNAKLLKLERRAWFECTDLWSEPTLETLAAYQPDLLICNPPYVPEPKSEKLEIEAGAGVDGTAHLMRAIELASIVHPRAMALSWCSLSDPGKILRSASASGYFLKSLFVVAIADGEYSGSVREHLVSLPHAYINESNETLAAVAPDGSARFAYLLMAGDFWREPSVREGDDNAASVQLLCERFASDGLAALRNPAIDVPVKSWLLDRWGELELRVILHGRSMQQKRAG
jgi:methylase of polypeptide subunit release factors